MADSTTKQVIDRLHRMIKNISQSNGYSTTIEQVNKHDVSPENLNNNLPACNIVMGDIDYTTARRNWAGHLNKSIPFVLDLYFTARNSEKEVELFTEIVEDFEIRFGDTTSGGNTAYNMSGTAYDLEGLVQQVDIVNAKLFQSDGQDMVNIEFEITVKYSQQRISASTFYCT